MFLLHLLLRMKVSQTSTLFNANDNKEITLADTICKHLADIFGYTYDDMWTALSNKSKDELLKSTKKVKKKRSRTAYDMYRADKDVVNDLKGLPFGERSTITSQRWKELDEESKDK